MPGAGCQAYVLRTVSNPALIPIPSAITAMITPERNGVRAICRSANRTSPENAGTAVPARRRAAECPSAPRSRSAQRRRSKCDYGDTRRSMGPLGERTTDRRDTRREIAPDRAQVRAIELIPPSRMSVRSDEPAERAQRDAASRRARRPRAERSDPIVAPSPSSPGVRRFATSAIRPCSTMRAIDR